MGTFYRLTCKNKDCRYSVELREGVGWTLFARDKNLQSEILNGEEDASDEIKDLLKNGYEIMSVTTFLCPVCKEYQINIDPFIFEPIHVSPYGTLREYKLHFVYGDPECEKCGTKLIHILNPRSPKNKCPKCGISEMKYGGAGYYD